MWIDQSNGLEDWGASSVASRALRASAYAVPISAVYTPAIDTAFSLGLLCGVRGVGVGDAMSSWPCAAPRMVRVVAVTSSWALSAVCHWRGWISDVSICGQGKV